MPGLRVPAAASDDLVTAAAGRFRVALRRLGLLVEVLVEHVAAPLGDVAVHVVESGAVHLERVHSDR